MVVLALGRVFPPNTVCPSLVGCSPHSYWDLPFPHTKEMSACNSESYASGGSFAPLSTHSTISHGLYVNEILLIQFLPPWSLVLSPLPPSFKTDSNWCSNSLRSDCLINSVSMGPLSWAFCLKRRQSLNPLGFFFSVTV